MDTNGSHMAESLIRAHQHWQTIDQKEPGPSGQPVPTFTIALSREAGTYGAAIAREVGDRLGWPVYDSELLQRIADDMGVRRTLLESVDERHVDWLSETLAGFLSTPAVSQVAYFRHLVETLLSLATHGECVIVGRGATKILPVATTLRVRVVAPLDHRVEAVRREHGITLEEAATRVEITDRERNRFVTSHFQIDATDPRNYDLILNVARFSKEECADIILAALDRLRAHQTSKPSRSMVGV
jgi:cytidylate kinase